MSRRGRRYHGEAEANGFMPGMEMVLNVSGVSGDSDLEGHEQWISVLAWSWGMSNSGKEKRKPIRILKAIQAKKNKLVKKYLKEKIRQQMEQKHQKEKERQNLQQATQDTVKPLAAADKITLIENAANAAAAADQAMKADGAAAAANGTPTDNHSIVESKVDSVAHGANGVAPFANTNADEVIENGAGDSDDESQLHVSHSDREAALADYDSDNDEDNDFDDCEMKGAKARVNMQDLSFTKYIDRASPGLMLKCLARNGSGFDCTLRVCKRRPVKTQNRDEDAKDEETDDSVKAGDADKSNEKHGSDEKKDAKEEEKKVFEAVVLEEYFLQGCGISSISKGGSGGEDRLTENVTITFNRLVHTYTDWLGNDASHPRKGDAPSSQSILYDDVRHKAVALDQAVGSAIYEQRELAPVSTVLMDYLNLRSKGGRALGVGIGAGIGILANSNAKK